MAVISILNAAATKGYLEIVSWNKGSRRCEMWFNIQPSTTIDSPFRVIMIHRKKFKL